MKYMRMIHCVCLNRAQQLLTAMCLLFSAASDCRIRNLGLGGKIGTFLGPFWYFGPIWDQVPNSGPYRSACIHPLPFSRLVPEQEVLPVLYCEQSSRQSTKGLKGWDKANKGGYHLQKTIQRWPNLDFTAFRFPHGDKSSVQGFQFCVLKFCASSKVSSLFREEFTKFKWAFP